MAPIVLKTNPEIEYEMLEKMGSGSYGTVWKAKKKTKGIFVAVKMIDKTLNDGGIAEVLKEVDFLQQCQHPNIVNYIEAYDYGNFIWVLLILFNISYLS